MSHLILVLQGENGGVLFLRHQVDRIFVDPEMTERLMSKVSSSMDDWFKWGADDLPLTKKRLEEHIQEWLHSKLTTLTRISSIMIQ